MQILGTYKAFQYGTAGRVESESDQFKIIKRATDIV